MLEAEGLCATIGKNSVCRVFYPGAGHYGGGFSWNVEETYEDVVSLLTEAGVQVVGAARKSEAPNRP